MQLPALPPPATHRTAHNPYIFQTDNPARQAWREGFKLIRDAMTYEYQRGVQNGQELLLHFEDNLITPPAPITILANSTENYQRAKRLLATQTEEK